VKQIHRHDVMPFCVPRWDATSGDQPLAFEKMPWFTEKPPRCDGDLIAASSPLQD
jgi:hypothetical protein